LAVDAEGEQNTVPTLQGTLKHRAVIILHRIENALVERDFFSPIGMSNANSKGDLHPIFLAGHPVADEVR
tara:strand:- start:292 stop:501 length:210 start_codon:yes stop_codon:yes gene_type:complete